MNLMNMYLPGEHDHLMKRHLENLGQSSVQTRLKTCLIESKVWMSEAFDEMENSKSFDVKVKFI